MSTCAYRGILGRFPRQGHPQHRRQDAHHPHPQLCSGIFCRGHGVDGFRRRGQVTEGLGVEEGRGEEAGGAEDDAPGASDSAHSPPA